MLSLFFLAGIIQIFYYLFFYLRLKNPEKNISETQLPLSVIICAKNEKYNLSKNLPKILEQDYKNFEVIVVDDASADETPELLKRLEQKYSNLRHTTIPKSNRFKEGKKFAQTLGIKSAKKEYLVFTDADCVPLSDLWLQKINDSFLQEKEIILLYGKYKQTKAFLNKVIRFDAFFIVQQYLTFSLRGINYMGVGRNLAYKKSLFEKNKGFASHLGLSSGDDDLFINEAANKQNVIVEITPESFTESTPKKTFLEWINQKSRHLSTAHKYKRFHKILLTLEPITRVLLLLIIWLIMLKFNILASSVFLLIILLIKFFVYKKNLSVLRDKDLLLYSLIIDLILPFINLLIFINLKFTKHLKWK